MKLSRAIYNTLAVSAVIVGVANAADHSFSAEITNALSSGVNMGATIAPSSTIEISANNVALDIVPSINGTFSSDYTTVSTYTNTDNTCTVTMTTSSTNLTSGNNTIPTLDSDVTEANFTNDHWGFRVGTSGNYRAVAASNTIATYSQTTGSTSLDSDVYFAAKLTAAIKAGNYTDTVTFISTCAPDQVPANINNLIYMQDFATLTSSEKAEVLNSMTLNQQYQLKDNRDEKDYYIAKLADGNVWMTQNLDHDIVTTENFYTYANTDIGHGSTPNTSATWTADTATYVTDDTNWNNTGIEPESYNPGDLCWNGTIREWGTITTETVACGNDKHYHIGNYYNWTAAVAMNESWSYTMDLTDVDQSICPAGWRLPTYSGDKSYANLVTTLSLTSGTSGNIQNTPVYFAYSGRWDNMANDVSEYGYYWSSVAIDGEYAYGFYFNMYGDIDLHVYNSRDFGESVRCVAR